MTAAHPSATELRRGEIATLGPRPDSERPRPGLRILECRKVVKNSPAFLVVDIPPGIIIRQAMVPTKNGRWWVSLPEADSRQRGKADHQHAGHRQDAVVVGWRSRDLGDRFSTAVIELLRQQHPRRV